MREHLVLLQSMSSIELSGRFQQRLAEILVGQITTLDGNPDFLRPITLCLGATRAEKQEAKRHGADS